MNAGQENGSERKQYEASLNPGLDADIAAAPAVPLICREYNPPAKDNSQAYTQIGSARIAAPIGTGDYLVLKLSIHAPKANSEGWRVGHGGTSPAGTDLQRENFRKGVMGAISRHSAEGDGVPVLRHAEITLDRLCDVESASVSVFDFSCRLGPMGTVNLPGLRVMFINGKPVGMKLPRGADFEFEGDWGRIERELLAQICRWHSDRNSIWREAQRIQLAARHTGRTEIDDSSDRQPRVAEAPVASGDDGSEQENLGLRGEVEAEKEGAVTKRTIEGAGTGNREEGV